MKFTESDMISVAMNRKENQDMAKHQLFALFGLVGIGCLLAVFGGGVGLGLAIALVVLVFGWSLRNTRKMAEANKIEGKALFDNLPDNLRGSST